MAWTPPPQPTLFNTPPENLMILDVETVPKVEEFKHLDEHGQKLFVKKFAKEETPEKAWKEKAALHCEFNKIACVTIGVFNPGEEGQRTLRVKSFFGYNEQMILNEVKSRLGMAAGKDHKLVAHNGKLFDFPLLFRKYIQYGIAIPTLLNTAGIKPWESSLFDTMEVWQSGEYKNYTSLDTLAYIAGMESPKEDFNGSMVADVYYSPSKKKKDEMPWEDQTLRPIATYCEGDVVTLAQLILWLTNKPLVKPEDIIRP